MKRGWLWFVGLFLVFSSLQAQDQEVSLEELLYGGQTFVVAATKRIERAVEAPSNVTVYTYEELQNLGVQTLMDLIRLVPGGDEHLESLLPMALFRGLTTPYANKILVLVDGRPQNTASLGHAYYDWQQPLGPWVDRVEIIKGPGSALYGANAFAGVINIVTRTPDSSSFNHQLTVGDYNLGAYNGYIGNKSGDFSYLLGGRWVYFKGYDPVAHFNSQNLTYFGNSEHSDLYTLLKFQGKRWRAEFTALGNEQGRYGNYRYPTSQDRSKENRYQGELKYDHPLSENMTLTVKGWSDYLEGNYNLTTYAFPVKDLTQQAFDSLTYNPLLGGTGPHAVVEQGDPTKVWLFNPLPPPQGCGDQVYHLITDPNNPCGPITMTPADMLAQLSQGKYVLLTEIPSGPSISRRKAYEFQGGGELQLDWLISDRVYALLGASAIYQRVYHEAIQQGNQFTGTNVAAYAQLQWLATDWLKALLGVRYDYHSIYKSYLSPRFALVMTPFPRFVAKLMYGQAFRAPNYVELYVDQQFITAHAQGNANLKPEGIQTLEGVLSYTPSKYLKIDASAYYNTLQKSIWSTPTLQNVWIFSPDLSLADPNLPTIPGFVLPTDLRQVVTAITYENYPDVTSYGTEIHLESRPTLWLRLFADYTYLKLKPVNNDSSLYFLNYFTDNANLGLQVTPSYAGWTFPITFVRHFQGGRDLHFYDWKNAPAYLRGFANLVVGVRRGMVDLRVGIHNLFAERDIYNPYPWEEYVQNLRGAPTEEEQFYPGVRQVFLQFRVGTQF